MGRGHLERLTSLDTAFLETESPTQHMHVGGLLVFDPVEGGASIEFGDYIALVRSRLHMVPRFRQKLAFPPMAIANPVWIDDEEFDLSFHCRHAALPRPGTMAQLTEYVGRIMSRPLDRERPLWELYLIEGLEHGRFAVLGKTHHAMVDGVAGIDIAAVMLDLAPPDPAALPVPEEWHPSSAPTRQALALTAVREFAGSPGRVVENVRRMIKEPLPVVRRVGRTLQGLASFMPNLRPAPPSPLNKPTGVWRRFSVQRVPLADVKTVKHAFGTTVNDVVLAIVADATGRFLRSRGEDTKGLTLRAMVPVSVRSEEEVGQAGNRVSSVFCPLPMDEMDPVQRLEAVSESMRDLKSSHGAVGADFLIGLTGYAPPTLHAMAARLAASNRLYNFLVTNVPGPQVPLYTIGGRLLGAFPFVPLAPGHTYAVGVTSIDGWLNFGFTGDYDALPDLENATGYLVQALKELVQNAEASDTVSKLARKPTIKRERKPAAKAAADA